VLFTHQVYIPLTPQLRNDALTRDYPIFRLLKKMSARGFLSIFVTD